MSQFEIERLENELQKADYESGCLRQDLEEAERIIDELRDEIDMLNNEISDLNDQLADAYADQL